MKLGLLSSDLGMGRCQHTGGVLSGWSFRSRYLEYLRLSITPLKKTPDCFRPGGQPPVFPPERDKMKQILHEMDVKAEEEARERKSPSRQN
jgi:hypothetical protein